MTDVEAVVSVPDRCQLDAIEFVTGDYSVLLRELVANDAHRDANTITWAEDGVTVSLTWVPEEN